MMYCDKCGTEVAAETSRCPRCAAALVPAGPPAAVGVEGAGAWVAAGWTAVTSNFWIFVLLALLYLLGASLLSVFLQGPLALALQWAALRQVLGRQASTADINTGFRSIGTAILAALLQTIIITLASFLLIIPGLIAAAMLQFVYLLILDRNRGFAEAITESIELSKPYFGRLVLLTILQIGILIGGALLCGVGILVAIPLNFAATAAAYQQIAGITAATRARLS